MSVDMQEYARVAPGELRTAPPFSLLFPIDASMLRTIERNMEQDGYDPSKPINVWQEENIVLDGHTRLAAALATGIKDVPVCFHSFDDEDKALAYAISNQKDRRNITGADIMRCIKAVDERKRPGERTDLASSDARSLSTGPGTRKSAEVTAKIVGVHRCTVERARAVIDYARVDPTIEKDVLEGRRSITMAAREVRHKKQKEGETYPMPAATITPKTGKRAESSVVETTPADDQWLSSLPLRGKVVAHRFDEDALLYREVAPLISRIKEALTEVIGVRSAVGMAPLYRALNRVARAAPIEQWQRCDECAGSGFKRGLCKNCHGSGYTIPGLK